MVLKIKTNKDWQNEMWVGEVGDLKSQFTTLRASVFRINSRETHSAERPAHWGRRTRDVY